MHASDFFRRCGVALVALALALTTAIFAAPPAQAVAQTFDVTSLADSGAGSLREAVGLANLNNSGIDIISFTIPGTVTLTSGVIVITDGVVISGDGFTPTITRSGNQAIFSIDIDAGVASVDRNVFFEDLRLDGAAPTTGFGIFVLDNELLASLTISESSFNDFDGPFEGGVLRVLGLSGDVRIFDSTFSNNDSTAQGGAISVAGAPDGVSISDSTFTNNTASNGAALWVGGSGQVSLVRSAFTANASLTQGGAADLVGNSGLLVNSSTFSFNAAATVAGGAIHINGAVNGVTVTGSTFTTNRADINGGAMDIVGVDGVQVSGSAFTDNVATGGVGGALNIDGGGVVEIADAGFTDNRAVQGGAIQFASLTDEALVERTVFSGNDALLNGGAISVPSLFEGVAVFDSSFEANTASDPNGPAGGAIWVSNINGATFLVQSSTFTENEAADGGVSVGIDVITSGQAVIQNSTMVEDDANPNAVAVGTVSIGSALFLVNDTIVANGAVHIGNVSGGLVLISHSIINGDVNGTNQTAVFRDGGDSIVVEWSILTTAFLAPDMSAGFGNQFSTDPLLGPLDFYGGYTETMLPATTGSPAVNAGDPSYSFGLADDQRGEDRISQGRVDIGSVEVQAAALATTGIEISPLLPLLGGGMLLLGLGALFAARRRTA